MNWNQECREAFIDLIIVPLLAYGSVCWVSLLGALI
jgi:hypothetical protein